MKKAILYFAFLMVSTVIFSACTHKPVEENITTDEQTAPVVGEAMMADDHETAITELEDSKDEMMKKEAREISMEMGGFYYAPNVIEAESGETLTVTIENVKGFHDFVIDELDVKSKQINEGNSVTVTFTVPEDASGKEYEFYCSVGNHRAQGMVGTVMVK